MKQKIIQIIAMSMIMMFLVLPIGFALDLSQINVNTTTSTAEVTWKTSEQADSKVYYDKSLPYSNEKYEEELTTEHSILLENLDHSTEYSYSVESTDSGGYKETSETLNFQTKSEDNSLMLNIDQLPESVQTLSLNFSGETEPNTIIRIRSNEIDRFITGEKTGYQIKAEDGKFSGEIKLFKGKNEIKFIAAKDSKIRTEKRTVEVDSTPPEIALNPIKTPTNQKTIKVTGSVSEASHIKILIDNQVKEEIEAQRGLFSVNLTNIAQSNPDKYLNISAEAADIVGNMGYADIQTIHVDTKAPDIDKWYTDFSEPTHFSIYTIEGKTEPNTEVTAINVYEAISLEDHYNPETQRATISVDPTSLIIGKENTAMSDSRGDFKVRINLMPGQLAADGNRLDGKNNICFVLKDKAGNKNDKNCQKITLKLGDINWYVSNKEETPNNIYMSDIKTGDFEATAFLEVMWKGIDRDLPDKVNLRISEDGHKGQNDLVHVGKNIKEYYDYKQRKLFILVPIKISQFSGSVDDYFGKLDQSTVGDFEGQLNVHLRLEVAYNTGGQAASGDIFTHVAYAIQKPEHLGKFLTPEQINKTIENLIDPAIEISEKIRDTALELSTYTLASCIALYIYNTFIPLDTGSKKTLFMVCDRVFCPPVPPKMTGFEYTPNIGNNLDKAITENDLKSLDEGKTSYDSYYGYYGFEYPGAPNFRPNPLLEFKNDAEYEEYQKNVSKYNKKYAKYLEENVVLSNEKTGERIEFTEENGKLYREVLTPEKKGVYEVTKKSRILSSDVGVFNSENYYDDERDYPKCFGHSESRTIYPTEDIYDSARCGCLPGIYGFFENIVRILGVVKNCLVASMMGETTPGLCEEMMLQYACDFLTDVVFEKILESAEERQIAGGIGGEKNQNGIPDKVKSIKDAFGERYTGTVNNKLGLSQRDIIHKSCLAAAGADISILEGAFEEFVKDKPTAPMHMISGYSRPMGADPFEGTMSIYYHLYVGIVPGSIVHYKVYMACDRGYDNGNFCPANTKQFLVPGYSNVLTKEQILNENIVVPITNSLWWYNKLILEITYELEKDHTETKTYVAPIKRKGDMPYGCQFDLFSGIVCKPLAIDPAGIVKLIKEEGGEIGTHISPMKAGPYHSGNKLSALVKIRNNYDDNFLISAKMYEPGNTDKEKPWKEYFYEVPKSPSYNEIQHYNILLEEFGEEGTNEQSVNPNTLPWNAIWENDGGHSISVGEGIIIKDTSDFVDENSNVLNKLNVKIEGNNEYFAVGGWETESGKLVYMIKEISNTDQDRKEITEMEISKITIYQLSKDVKKLTIYKYVPDKEETILGTIIKEKNVEVSETKAPYLEGHYNIELNVVKLDGDGYTPLGFEDQTQNFRVLVKNQQSRDSDGKIVCGGRIHADLIEPLGNYLPLDGEIPIGANIIDDCNELKSIKVEIRDDNSGVNLCEGTINVNTASTQQLNCKEGSDVVTYKGNTEYKAPYYRFIWQPSASSADAEKEREFIITLSAGDEKRWSDKVSRQVMFKKKAEVRIEEISLKPNIQRTDQRDNVGDAVEVDTNKIDQQPNNPKEENSH